MSCHLWSPYSFPLLAPPPRLSVALGQLLSCLPGKERRDRSVWEVMWVDLIKGDEMLSSENTQGLEIE